MRSKLAQTHFAQGNGYGHDGTWRHEFQRRIIAVEALKICYGWIDGHNKTEEYRDAIYAFLDVYGDWVKQPCRALWAASCAFERGDEEAMIECYDWGIERITKYHRRQADGSIKTGFEHRNGNPYA